LDRHTQLCCAQSHTRNEEGRPVLFYHSGEVSSVVALAKVTREAFQDPTTKEDAWSAIELSAIKPFKEAVSLSTIKATPALKDMLLVKISRLSAMPVREEEFKKILEMGKTKP
jgi:predicted RNA-binding protein with PUA-like domain